MNIREGARRLGILLGVLGATIACKAEYESALKLWTARAASRRFESLMVSPRMVKVAKAAKEGGSWDDYARKTDIFDALARKYGGTVEPDFDGLKILMIHRDGINEATIDKSGTVQSIQPATGPLVERTPAPALADYFGLLIYPLLGFLVPWGSIRALTWVATGFFQPKLPAA